TTAYPSDPTLIVRNNSVTNNYFTNVAVEFKGGHGIWGGYVQDVRFEHNHLSGTAYTAISLGWGWSPAQTVCMNNSVSYNHITNYMMEMKDGAAIYTLSLQNNTRVEYNHIHDGAGSGLYPDEQTWMTAWRYNVVYRSGNSLQDHSLGPDRNDPIAIRENIIEDNYFDKDPIIEPRRQVPHIPNNIWNITGNPAPDVLAIVSSAGLEPAYQGLLQKTGMVATRQWTATGCASCLYWSDIPPEDHYRSLEPVPMAIVIAGITGFGIAGVVVMHKQAKQSMLDARRREP
nr:right-handed parallel beta-helix repeat-containing protein [Candidatus Sigynarchaeota archaeon]